MEHEKFTNFQYIKVIELIQKEIPNIIKEYPDTEFEYSMLEKKYDDLHKIWIYRIEKLYQQILYMFEYEARLSYCSAHTIMLSSFFKCKSTKDYIYFMAIEACIRVCKHLIAEESKDKKSVN